MTKIIIMITLMIPFFLYATDEVTSNYDLFESKTNNITKEISTVYKMPTINQGFVISRENVSPFLSMSIFEKKKYSFDVALANKTIGMINAYKLVNIIDLKIGWYCGYSLDKDYAYKSFFNGISISLYKW